MAEPQHSEHKITSLHAKKALYSPTCVRLSEARTMTKSSEVVATHKIFIAKNRLLSKLLPHFEESYIPSICGAHS
ncbi:hypothetical protein PanWU01x14_341450 [Parasponia andersonii]|uniref:Uncharacterized protein n=1 Tax=Parasponia andersonii TaxID=3476 RepID=A0A2P5AE38_PARAD|nr:hypothetical protein PanWU01x14_341450 [Parasponia andersonii]